MHVRAISLCVTPRKADDDDAFAAHARDACVEVLILTHRALFFPLSSARPPAVLAREASCPEPGKSSATWRWLNRENRWAISKAGEKNKKKKGNARRFALTCVYCVRSLTCTSASLHVTRERRDTRAATRTYGRGLRSALLLAGRVCAWTCE